MNYFATDKLLKYPDRIAHWLEHGWTWPITWEFDLTDRCQHRCPACAGGRCEGEPEMSRELAMDVVDQMAAFRAVGLTFTGGGEPLLHPAFPDVFERTLNKGLHVAVITNGSALTLELSRLLSRATWVRVSLDAATPADYERTHGLNGRAWDKTLANIRLLAQHAHGATVGLAYLVDTENSLRMAQAAALAHDLGVSYIQFRPFHRGTVDLADAHMRALSAAYPTGFVQWTKWDWPLARYYSACYGLEFCSVVQANGDITLCCHTRGQAWARCGNLAAQSLADIWQGERRRTAKAMIALDRCLPLCRCDALNRTLWQIAQPHPHAAFL